MPLVGLVNHLVIIQTVVMCNLTVLKFYHTRSSKVVQQIQSEKQLTVNLQTNFEFTQYIKQHCIQFIIFVCEYISLGIL